MANIKSSKKDLKRNHKNRTRNTEVKSALKTYVKKVRTAAAGADPKAIDSALIVATKAIDKAVQRGVIHKNQAARRKSRIAKAANAAIKAGPIVEVVAPKRTAKAATTKKAGPKPSSKTK
jgi:small subunit ribosomal protein S20